MLILPSTHNNLRRLGIVFGYILLILSLMGLLSCDDVTKANPSLKISLNAGWEFREAGDVNWREARVPGCVHTDLMAQGLIPDPYFGANEPDLQWIGERGWEYHLRFDLPEGFARETDMYIVFNGLDTYAEVFLNGRSILTTDNMFVRWEVECSDILKETDNELLVSFSPVSGMDSLRITNSGVRAVTDYALHRKAAYHFGWDWGPRYLTSGIWQEVILEQRSPARIADAFIRQDSISDGLAIVTAVIDLEGALSSQGRLKVICDGREWTVDVPAGEIEDIALEMRIEEPRLWNPNGMGEQHLSEFSFTLASGGMPCHEYEVRTGLRRLELVQESDSCGRSFAFSVNDRPLFARGANLIPLDMFPSRVDPSEYESLLNLAADAGVNMLRVWGGGIYENEMLYDLCDRLGILVWQDFMFACSMYPADSLFLNSVALEASQQVIRLRNHPCLAIWCGNNENWVGWNNWGWKDMYTEDERLKVEQDYRALFDTLLPGIVGSLDPGRAYWPSSPLHNWAREDVWDGGDLHYWGVWHGEQAFEAFTYRENIGRFVSEFGMQSFPTWHSLGSFLPEDAFRRGSAELMAHQKHRIGFPVIDKYLQENYPLPVEFQDYVNITRALQAYGMEMAIAAHRRHTPCCAGSLFWQWNDVWPGVTWSAIDGEGVPKPLYYKLKRLFDDVLLQGVVEHGRLRLFLNSDTLEGMVRIRFSINGLDGEEFFVEDLNTQLRANGTVGLDAGTLDRMFGPLDPASLFWKAEAVLPDGRLMQAHGFFVKPGQLKLSIAEVTLSLKEKEGYYILELGSAKLVKDIEIMIPGNPILSDNGFDLIPGQPRTIRIIPGVRDSEPMISVWSLNDALHRP